MQWSANRVACGHPLPNAPRRAPAIRQLRGGGYLALQAPETQLFSLKSGLRTHAEAGAATLRSCP